MLYVYCVDLYVCFVLYCSLYGFCVYIKFTLQYNGGNKDVYIVDIITPFIHISTYIDKQQLSKTQHKD